MPEGSTKAVVSAIAANVAVCTLKFIGAAVTGSSGLLSEGVHSLVDTLDSVLLLVGRRLSTRPPDRTHPLGHGRELYFWSMVVSMIVFGAGGCVNVFEGVRRILQPKAADNLVWSYAILAASAVFDGISLAIGLKQFRRKHRVSAFFRHLRQSKDPTIYAVILEDSADLAGITAAFLGIWLGERFGMHSLDGVASVVIGCILGGMAFLLGRECHGLLIGESADREMLDRIVQSARNCRGVDDIGDPLTVYFGPHDVMLALPVRFREDLSAADLAETIDRMEGSIRREAPDVTRIFIEPESELIHAHAETGLHRQRRE